MWYGTWVVHRCHMGFMWFYDQIITTCKGYINRDVMKIWEHERYVVWNMGSQSVCHMGLTWVPYVHYMEL